MVHFRLHLIQRYTLIKQGCWNKQTELWIHCRVISATAVRGGSESLLRQICSPHITAGACDSEEMFSSLAISKSPDFRKHMNQYDVIHLDIQWCMEPAGGPERVVSYITEKTIGELKE